MDSQTGKVDFSFATSLYGTPLSTLVKCFNPNWYDAYGDIENHIESLVEEAIQARA